MRRALSLFAIIFLTLVPFLASASSAEAKPAPHTLIQGSGSSWASNAIEQWIHDVAASGLQVAFTPNGSAAGRQDYANYIDDFAVSDIGFQGKDPQTGQNDTSNGRSYAYLPIVAGGTSLPYQVRVNGREIDNLRLSGKTVADIFTGQITNWDDAAIKKDNPGLALPNLPIIPVVHSEGSGSTYQFTRYLYTDYKSIYQKISNVAGGTEYFPQTTSGNFVRESGSDAVMNYIGSAAANGAIGYDEYSYPLAQGIPVAKLLNTAGYYTLPNQYNVAVALTRAKIITNKKSPNYLLQNLNNVYTYGDPRVYPMSSYSYAIIPTAANDQRMTLAKRQTIADFLDYSVCQGQAEMGKVGYSPLPINLVEASFAQVAKLHQADPGVDISQARVQDCNNPTFIAGHPSENYLAKVAPQPQPCDHYGHPNCTDAGNTGQLNPNQGGAKTSKGNGPTHSGNSNPGGGSNTSAGSGNTNTGSGNTNTGTGNTNTGSGNTSPGTGSSTSGTTNSGSGSNDVNAVTGQSNSSSGNAEAVGQATSLSNAQSPSVDIALGILAGAVLLALLIVPPVVASRVKRNNPR